MKSVRDIVRKPLSSVLELIGFISVVIAVWNPIALAQMDARWIPTGSLHTSRDGHTATVLPNGKVLVVGGDFSPWDYGSGGSPEELYDPTTGVWTVTGSLNIPRSNHTATLLLNGKVLVAGGMTLFGTTTRSAELYDPNTETWSITGAPITARYGHTATLLENGMVLIAGGSDDFYLDSTLSSSELYDPATGIWSSTGNLNASRIFHTNTFLPNGKILVAGGYTKNHVAVGRTVYSVPVSLSGTEVYDPATGTWSMTGNLNTGRNSHTATMLPNGKVLVVGGGYWSGGPCPCFFADLNSSELYDPVTGTWRIAGSLNTARYSHTATPLPNGKVLVAAGGHGSGDLNTSELYDPTSETWSATASLNTPRLDHTATLIAGGKVLVVGGSKVTGPILASLSSAELFEQNATPSISITDVTVTEGNSGTATATFQVNLSAPSNQSVTVSFSTANRTANAGTDYVGTSGSLTFDPGETTKTITVVVNGNDTLELDKTFVVNLTSATNAFIADGQGVGTIINDDGPVPQMLANISSRGAVLTGNNVMIGGFIVDGSTPKRVLVRSRGPSMAAAPFFVPGTLANPVLQLFSGPTMIAQSDNWQEAPSCPGFVCEGAAEILNTGLDPCTPNPGQSSSPANCALEAALLITLPPGPYTAITTGAGNSTGLALVEVFEADASVVSELSNISTRGFVQSGDGVMIGGLIIEGSSPATVLIRGRGPSMSGAPFSVPGTLANPVLQLFSDRDLIAQNDNWQDAPSCTAFVCGTAAQIAATHLDPCQPNPGQTVSPPNCTLESAILINLPPGAYTAIISGVGNTTGVGLVDVFEIN
jgi:N-acetylneuraminic acid mutarotase